MYVNKTFNMKGMKIMKKIILSVLCSALLLSGCASNVSTIAPAPDGARPPYEQINGEGKGWGFVRKKGEPPEITAAQREAMQSYDCYYIDDKIGRAHV